MSDTVPLAIGLGHGLDRDDFTLLGLPQRFAIDEAALAEAWRAWQVHVHPDKYVSEDASMQRIAMQWSVRINEAHRRLKDPVQRGVYLCGLRGFPLNTQRPPALPGSFLVQQMQWREALEDANDVAQVQALAQEVAAQRDQALRQLEQHFDIQTDGPMAQQTVQALMYIQRMWQELTQRRHALEDLA